jgi:hypothetical protein
VGKYFKEFKKNNHPKDKFKNSISLRNRISDVLLIFEKENLFFGFLCPWFSKNQLNLIR